MSKPSSLQSYINTSVPPGTSKDNIETLLQRVGADAFRWSSMAGHETLEASLQWEGRRAAFRLSIDYENDKQRKQKLRALFWYLKAKIEAIQFGLVDLEHEFLPYLLTASGRTVFEELPVEKRSGWLLEPPREAP